MDEKKYCEALLTYKKGLASAPDDTSLLYNGGLAAFQCKQYPAAVELWKHLEGLDAKVAERDQERAELFDLRKNDSSGDIAKRIEYCRDQFEAGGEKIMAFEHFELKGDRAVRYVFSIIDESKNAEKYRLSLGSYDTTNAIWHETTKPRPKDSDRLFHLDGYYDWGHATYGMYFPEPSYDDVRTAVIEILEKKKNPLSTSTRAAPQK
jgi:tetratricopeptide (TPR) repeat protein